MTGSVESTPRRWSRCAGLFYLITIVMGVFAELFVRGALIVRDDPAATGRNILSHELLYRSGLAADLIMLAAYLVVTLLFYELFRSVCRPLSLLGAYFSLIGIAILAVNCLTHIAPLLFLRHAPYLDIFPTAQLQALALVSLKLHGRGYNLSGVFFGLYCVVLGYLFFRTRFVPRFLGVLMVLGGLSYFLDSFLIFLVPTLSARLPGFTLLGGIAELALSVWLVVKGVDAAKWNESEQPIEQQGLRVT